jgi:soluble lytic murein transglycosylase
MVLDDLDGSMVLATAAYNAGPAKVSSWLPYFSPVPADIWVETIPYKETRKYVSSVLTYAIIYQHLMQRTALKMQDFMRDVQPG